MISKKDLLKEMNISYGQLYRWKREGLIPDDWFNKQSVSTGQETFFKRSLIIPRIEKILELKDKYQLEELKEFFNPSIEGRKFSLREAIILEMIDPFILRMYSTKKDTFTITDMVLNETVTMEYTVANHETDVDATLTGVGLTNSNEEYFDVNYTINGAAIDANDGTTTVTVTVKLVKTPVTDEQGKTTVSLTLNAAPVDNSN